MATKSQIIVDSNNTYVPNTSGLITPQQVQTLNTNWINASIFPEQTGSMSVQSAATASFLLGSVASASFSAFAVSASQSATASYALTASFALNVPATSSFAISASFAQSASLATRNLTTASAVANILTFTKGDGTTFNVTVAQSGSVLSASFADTANQANSASLATTASFAISSSRAISSLSASYAFTASSAIAANTAVSATSATSALTSISASWASTAGTANTASFIAGVALLGANNTFTGITTFNNNVTASNVRITGTASIAFLDVQFQSSSVIYSSGSNQFGDASNDTQTLWGTVNVISGPLVVTGSANFKETITGSISTAINANTASYHGVGFVSASQVGGNDKVSLTTQAGTTTTLTINNVAAANTAGSATTATSASYATNAGSANSATSASNAALLSGIPSSSFANTGSNTFNGNQTIANGFELRTNEIQATIAGGLMVSSSGNLGVARFGNGGGQQAEFFGQVSAVQFSGSGANVYGVVSSSYALSASFATNSITASYFNGLVASASYALVAETANNALTANVANSAISATSASYATTAGTVSGTVTTALTASAVKIDNISGAGAVRYFTLVDNATGFKTLGIDTSHYINGAILYTDYLSALNGVSPVNANVTSAVTATSASYAYTASSAISAGTASYAKNFIISGSQVITGSLVGQPVSQSVSSLTASLNLQAGNFFNLTLPASVNTYITASGQVAGQTINLKITQQATTGSVSFGAGFKQVSGSAYSATATANAVDIVTFISFDNTGLYVSNVKNLI